MTSEITKLLNQTCQNFKDIFVTPFRFICSAFKLNLQIIYWIVRILIFRSSKTYQTDQKVETEIPNTDSRTRKFTFSHTWTVENFSKYCDLSDRPSMGSIAFGPSSEIKKILTKNLESKQFELLFYPKGNTSVQQADYISMFIRYTDNDVNQEDCTVMYQFSVVDVDKKKREQIQYIAKMVRGDRGWGRPKWIAHADLFNPEKGYLVDGNLIICCEVSFLVTDLAETELSEKEMIASGKVQLSKNISSLWKMRELTGDLEIQVSDGKVLSAHKVILASRCSVFSAMFRHKNTKESIENRIHFPDMSAEVCEAFLEYLYTGTVNSLVEQAEFLLPVADKYQMDHLKSICERTLIAQISLETVQKFLHLAERHNAEKLHQKALDFIKKDIQETLKSVVDYDKMAIEINQFLGELKNRNE